MDREVVDKLGEYSQKILEKRRKARGYQPAQSISKQEQIPEKQAKIVRGSSEIIEEYDESMEVSIPRLNSPTKTGKVKPSHLKNLNNVLSSNFLSTVKDLIIILHRIYYITLKFQSFLILDCFQKLFLPQ